MHAVNCWRAWVTFGGTFIFSFGAGEVLFCPVEPLAPAVPDVLTEPRWARKAFSRSPRHFTSAALNLALRMFTPLALKIGPLPEVLGSGKFTPFSRIHVANFVNACLSAGVVIGDLATDGLARPPAFGPLAALAPVLAAPVVVVAADALVLADEAFEELPQPAS